MACDLADGHALCLFLHGSLLLFRIPSGSYCLRADINVMNRRQNRGVELTLTLVAQLVVVCMGGGREVILALWAVGHLFSVWLSLLNCRVFHIPGPTH